MNTLSENRPERSDQARASVNPFHRPPAASSCPASHDGAGLWVGWARHEEEVKEAQKLRYDIFSGVMGARLNTHVPGLDVDLFDVVCEHLLVRDVSTRQVVGTYRVLTPAQARRIGSTYSDMEFDLTRLRSLRSRMVELGRACVHPDHRHGGVVMALWCWCWCWW